MSDDRQFCTFAVGGHLFGVPVLQVQEVIRYQVMTLVPHAPDMIGGLINLRGQIVMAMDLRRRLEFPDREAGTLPMNVVVNTKYLDRPIFAGTSATTQAYDSTGAFMGDTSAVNRTIGPGVTVQVNVTGPQAFGPPGNDMFSTLAKLADDLRNNPSAVNASDLGAMDIAASRVRSALGEVGARGAQLETTKTRSDDLLLNLRDSLSKIEDIDLPKVATDLQIQQVSYQAALAATAKVIQPSLVDFLK